MWECYNIHSFIHLRREDDHYREDTCGACGKGLGLARRPDKREGGLHTRKRHHRAHCHQRVQKDGGRAGLRPREGDVRPGPFCAPEGHTGGRAVQDAQVIFRRVPS